MKHGDTAERKFRVLNSLSGLPQKMLVAHGCDNVAELVLHELANNGCFNFMRAAYLVDNPDFDCLKGVAGFAAQESYQPDGTDAWQELENFSYHVQAAPFNQKVRGLIRPSFRRRGASDKEVAGALAGELGMQEHAFHMWDMRNDNHGLLVYEPVAIDDYDLQDLANGFSLLSFCPVF